MWEQVQEATFRIRNLSSLALGAGAGFGVSPHLIVTNRHVVEGRDGPKARAGGPDDDPLEVSTWDGRVVEVEATDMAHGHDLAALRTGRKLQGAVEFAQRPACAGDLVHVVGYPLGGQFTMIRGLVVDQIEGPALGDQSHVLRVKAVVLPGYSGGPILNVRGEVVGIVYALGRATRYALAIPVSSLSHWLASASLPHVRPVQASRGESPDEKAEA
ncbi:MAG: serine protease [Actinomycetota bacterium]|nr:serine protease [Actinomycetota bacterium]